MSRPSDFGYTFDPSVDYQPRVLQEFVMAQNGKVKIHCDGTVEADDGVLTHTVNPKGYNQYEYDGWSFNAYKSAAFHLWRKRPVGLTWVDHIDRVRTNDAFGNLRPCNASLNNLNQYRKNTKGYVHETKEWLERVNAYRKKTGKQPLYRRGTNTFPAVPTRGNGMSSESLTTQRTLQSAITRAKSRSFSSVSASSGLTTCVPDDVARIILELSGHLVVRSGGMAYHIFF